MNVIALACTSGRHTHTENVVGMYLEQFYEGESILIIFNNSSTSQKLDDIPLPKNKQIILVNCPINSVTKEKYKSLGEIFNDALLWIDTNVDSHWLEEALITHMHVDDRYLPHHFYLGVNGYYEGKEKGFNAFKPQRSFFLSMGNLSLEDNILEPSFFIHYPAFKATGGYYSDESIKYDKLWLENIKTYKKEIDIPSLVYCWNGDAYKISGDPNNPDNFENAKKNDTDEGDRVLSLPSKEQIQNLYNQVWQNPKYLQLVLEK